MALTFTSIQSEIIAALKTFLPKDVFIGRVIPSVRKEKMVVVIAAGGNSINPILAEGKVNLLIWGGKSWEECENFALDIDSKLYDYFYNLDKPTNIVDLNRNFLPQPAPESSGDSTPIFACSYSAILGAR